MPCGRITTVLGGQSIGFVRHLLGILGNREADDNRQRMDHRHRLRPSAPVRPRVAMSRLIRAVIEPFALCHLCDQWPPVMLAEGRGTAARSSIHL